MEASLDQSSAQSPHPVMATGLHGAQRYPHSLGDLRLAETFLAQAYHLGLLVGQRVEGLADGQAVDDLIHGVGDGRDVSVLDRHQWPRRGALADIGGSA